MIVITKEISMMNFLFNVLYEVDNDRDFIERLREELQDEDIKNLLNSSNEKTKSLFKEPYSVKRIKEHLVEANEIFEKAIEENHIILMKKLQNFENADFLKEYFSSEDKMLNLKINNSTIFIEEYYDSVLRKISFVNSKLYLNDIIVEEETVELCYDTINLVEENGSYILEITNYITNEFYKIKFNNISVLLKAYSAESDYLFWLFVNTPWDYVISLANSINAHFTYCVANEKEKRIFGLVKHLTGEHLTTLDSVPAELYDLIKKHNLQNVIKPPYDLTKPYLCKKKFELFWRDIFNLISDSQNELPSYFEETVSKEAFEKHKQLITEQMNDLGYEGTYPDYYKKDSLVKPTLFKTYNLSHVVAYEKFVEHHVHCYAFKNDDVIHTAFFVGTIFNKKASDRSDIYSTMFDCNGRAVFSILSTINAGAMNENTYEIWTRNAVKAAVKKANLKKADKDDFYFKSIFERTVRLNIKALILMFIFFSFGFSLITPLLLFILEGCSISEVISFLKSEPLLLLFSVVGGFIATFLIALFEWISGKK